MGHPGITVPPPERPEREHFEQGGRHYDGPPAVRALELDALPMLLLGPTLGRDEVFLRYALEASDERRARALARPYWRYGPLNHLVATMLLEASRTPNLRLLAREGLAPSLAADIRALVATRLSNMGRHAVYADGPLLPTDQRNRLRVGKVDALELGAQAVRLRGHRHDGRRGTDECLAPGCGIRLRSNNRGWYCGRHAPGDESDTDRDYARAILRSAAAQLGLDVYDAGARRARGRSEPPARQTAARSS